MDISVIIIFLSLFKSSYTSATQGEENNTLSKLPVDNTQTDSRPDSDHESDMSRILKRLETNEKLTQRLLSRVEHLESREKSQQQEILNLHNQLDLQKRQTKSLQRVLNHIFNRRTPLKSRTGENQTASTVIEVKSVEKEISSGLRATEEHKSSQRIRRAENENQVAFFATLSTDIQHAGVHQTYVFDHVITNLGSAYNNHNGNFVAPVSGTYVFSVTLLSVYHVNAHAQFLKNGQLVTRLYLSGVESGHDTASQTFVLQLHKGDDVCVHNLDLDASLGGSHYSSFAGFLLYEDYSSSAIVGK
ncbi:heavy metal-binding protein HIP-like [Mercenaria mercenaria]|uniref:heavy metal-binding protein HIP-like n=1 Tax=Mercenaria mercenaria TaxID=6596 RepID=UPI001E1DE62C|nr:heavy metal-binding protein HIP-like [Mercenaria mercenaria]